MSIISEKAIGYWDFRSGTIDDLVGSNDLVVSGTINLNREGMALGGAGFVSAVSDASLDVTGAFTISVWVKPTSTAGTTSVAARDGTGTYRYILYQQPGTTDFQFNVSTASGATATAAITLPINEWSLVTGVYDRTLGSSRVKIYLNEGTTTAAANGYDEDVTSQTGRNLQFGHYTSEFIGTIGASMLSSSALTQTEVAQLYAEIKDTVFPSKPSSKSVNKQKANINESGLVGAWDMKPVAGVIQDLSSNNNTGTIYGKPNPINSSLGYALKLNGVDADVEASDASLNFQGKKSLTLSAWVKTNDTTGTHYVLVNGINQYAYNFSIASNGRARIVIDSGWEGARDLYGTSTTLRDKQWHHLAATLGTDGTTSTLCLYVDGALENSSTFSDYTMTTSNNGMYIGRAQGTYSNSTIANTEIYDEAKSTAWVLSKYKSGASSVQYKPGYGINVSSANVAGGQLENTGWTVDSGTWQVNTTTIDGVKCKAFACTTDNGIIYRTADSMGMTPTEAAYGTWEFYWMQFDANNLIHVMVGDAVGTPGSVSANGYIFRYGVGERFRLRTETAGSIGDIMQTDAAYFTTGQWYKMKITRSTSGVWTAYRDGVLVPVLVGTNPGTENTHTTAKYLSIQARATDLIAIADVGGGHSFTKHLGVI